MKMTKLSAAIAVATIFSAGAHASALDNVSVHGFGTIGATYMGGEERTFGPKDGIDEGVSFKEDTKIGAQIRYMATDNLSFAAQAKVEAINEEFKPKVSWAYGSYRFNDSLTVRVGRLATPVYLKSDSLDIGYTYSWARPPVEVYGQVPIQSFEGIDVLYSTDVAGQAIGFQAYAGTVLEQDFSFLGNKSTVEADKSYGLSATLPFSHGFVRAVHAVSDGVNIDAGGPIQLEDLKGTFTAIGGEFNYGNASLIGEYALRDGPSADGLIPKGVSQLNGFYVTSAYQLTPTIKPHITYSRVDDKNSGGNQTSVTAGVRYDVYPGVAVKAEYSAVEADGYPGLYDASGLQGFGMNMAAPAMLEADSDIFSLSVDFVF